MGMRTWITGGVAATAAGAAYLRFVRPRVLHWGATADEVARSLPGDDILDDATLQTTRAISIDAGPAHIWPWLVQMGPRPRAGAYTYDWIERRLGIDIENTHRILPEFQHLDPGDMIGADEQGKGLRAVLVERERALVVQWVPQRSTWAFIIVPQSDGTARLISRNRLPGSGPLFRLGMVLFMEAGSLVMEAKMLAGIKRRAERLAGTAIPAMAEPNVGPA
jgi:hypothetical protein